MHSLSHPRVSVIVPVYNAMPYLTGALESVLAQDLPELEIIAVNDGSTDGSGAELDRFAARDPRVLVIHQANSGWPGHPRNRGIERAAGEYLFFMDADDTMAPQALRSMVELAERSPAKPPAEIVIPRFTGTGGRQVQSLYSRHPQGAISISRAMETLSPQKLFRREFIERHGLTFPEEQVRLEDGIFVAQAYTRANRIMFCGTDPLYFIALRDDGQNISSRSIDPENYVASCRRIAQILRDGSADTEAGDRLVLQFFQRKGLRFYAPKRWHRMSPETRTQWVDLHRAFLRDFVPEARDASLPHPTDRRKLGLIRAGDVAGIDALVAAEPGLAHAARAIRFEASAHGLELRVALVPEEASTRFPTAPPSALRLGALRAVDRLSTACAGNRGVRGASRRLAGALANGLPNATLILNGRRRNRSATLIGRPVGVDAGAGAPEYSFFLSEQLLASFGQDRVDLWTVAGIGAALSGGRVRLTASPEAVTASAAERCYVTRQGNASLRLSAG